MELDKIYLGDVFETLDSFKDGIIDMCVTSPPYWGLRDYGVKGQLGLEESPEAYLKKMVAVFSEVKRVLKPCGTLWLNMGDSYAGSGKGSATHNATNAKWKQGTNVGTHDKTIHNWKSDNIKPKDLVGIPWMLALALRNSGWYLRQDIIWSKPNPMPESVKDRCTRSHEYLFLLSKDRKYYYDYEAIKQPASNNTHERKARQDNGRKRQPTKLINGIRGNKAQKVPSGWDTGKGGHNEKLGRYPKPKNNASFDASLVEMPDFKNKRSVWHVQPEAFPDAHFATFPQKLVVDCIKAGCPENGIVLDPFMGAGTTALVAKKLGRHYVGIELNPNYIKIAENRIRKELGIFYETR